jgi:hypothetical protein
MAGRTFALLAIVLFAVASRAQADVFELKDGGQVTGELVERTEGGDYVVRTADGVQATLGRAQVQRIVPQDETTAEYERRSRTAPDTAEAHRELAEWSRQNGLTDEADHHLERVVDLDPEDEAARRSLGYERVGDRWLTREEQMAARGMVFFDGRWRTPQDVAVRQRDDAEGDVEAEWVGRLRRWRGWLDSDREDRVEEARAQIAAIDDPYAAAALVKLLEDEEDEWAFELLLATLGRLDTALTVQTLVAYSLEYDDAEIRALCVDYLVGGGRPVSIVPYVQALKSGDNIIVNRAGEALGVIGDPEAMSPLIDALVTTHKYTVQPSGGGPGDITAGFSPSGGGGGLQMGGNKPQIIERDRENLRVLRALTTLSGGQNFDYDELAWRHWFVDQQMRQHANARRDE